MQVEISFVDPDGKRRVEKAEERVGATALSFYAPRGSLLAELKMWEDITEVRITVKQAARSIETGGVLGRQHSTHDIRDYPRLRCTFSSERGERWLVSFVEI